MLYKEFDYSHIHELIEEFKRGQNIFISNVLKDFDKWLLYKYLNGPKIICCDFDDTLIDTKMGGLNTKFNLLKFGKPIIKVINQLRKEKQKGAHIIIHTRRIFAFNNEVKLNVLDAIRKWLKNNKVPYDDIWMGAGKPYANEYWDDRAVRKP